MRKGGSEALIQMIRERKKFPHDIIWKYKDEKQKLKEVEGEGRKEDIF